MQEASTKAILYAFLANFGIAVVLEAVSLMGCLREIGKLRREKTLREWLRTTRNAELVVVLGEDIAALVGLVLAFCFLGLAGYASDPRFDALGSICIGIVLIVVSVFVAIRIKGLLVGRSAEPALRTQIDRLIDADPEIEAVLNTITVQMGPRVMLAAKIRMRSGLTIDEAVTHINGL